MGSKVLKIGQISDIHIGNDPCLVQGIDVRRNFMMAYNSESMRDLDLLVLSGDIANEDAEPGAYAYMAEILKDCPVPYCIIPGNHDRIEIMEKYFDLKGKVHDGECYYRYDIAGKSIFFLDSACGIISKKQLAWIKSEAAKINGEILLFVHHPPCLCNHRFMDLKYSLLNMKETQETFAQIKNLHHIFAGHYHCDFEIEMGDQLVHVTPSTQMQIDANTPYFSLKSSAPGWRVIIWGDNFLETKVYF